MDTIYIYLMNEGSDAWRPAPATHVKGDVYRVERPDWYNPGDENWEFKPGSLVRVKEEYSEYLKKNTLVAHALWSESKT